VDDPIGLFMYDHLGKRTSLPGSKGLRFGSESVLKPEIVRGFEYSDCWVDDARLVLANAQMVEKKGGEVKTRTRATSARRENGLWIVEAEDIDTGEKFSWKARGLVNATGPWVKQFFDDGMHLPSPYGIRLIKGSHIVVPRVHTQKGLHSAERRQAHRVCDPVDGRILDHRHHRRGVQRRSEERRDRRERSELPAQSV
jgi:glycerol-3-phosphate dehydrogenase